MLRSPSNSGRVVQTWRRADALVCVDLIEHSQRAPEHVRNLYSHMIHLLFLDAAHVALVVGVLFDLTNSGHGGECAQLQAYLGVRGGHISRAVVFGVRTALLMDVPHRGAGLGKHIGNSKGTRAIPLLGSERV